MSSEDMSTHYSVLNCDENASKEEIRRQYKKLALKTHPDKCEPSLSPSSTTTTTSCQDFHRIDRAVKVLDNDLSRRQYDSKLMGDRSDNCIVNEEISLNDLTLNCDEYSYSCRCGGSYLIFKEDLYLNTKEMQTNYIIIDCNSCSLSVKLKL